MIKSSGQMFYTSATSANNNRLQYQRYFIGSDSGTSEIRQHDESACSLLGILTLFSEIFMLLSSLKSRGIVQALSTLLAMSVSHAALALPFINEFHYDNSGTDTGEFIEIAAPTGFFACL
jgi:hypothetical protein